jgi:hypothetical protein
MALRHARPSGRWGYRNPQTVKTPDALWPANAQNREEHHEIGGRAVKWPGPQRRMRDAGQSPVRRSEEGEGRWLEACGEEWKEGPRSEDRAVLPGPVTAWAATMRQPPAVKAVLRAEPGPFPGSIVGSSAPSSWVYCTRPAATIFTCRSSRGRRANLRFVRRPKPFRRVSASSVGALAKAGDQWVMHL